MKSIKWMVFGAICILLFLGIYLACSSSTNLTAPSEQTEESAQLPTVPDKEVGQRGLWGYYNVAIYPEENKVEITANRTAWMSINVVSFMHGPGGEMAGLEIEILEFEQLGSTGDCKIGVKLMHPYPTMPEFCGFDVMGLFITDGSGHGVENPVLRFPVLGDDPILLNDDGYTRWMNPTEFSDDAPWGYYDPLSEENSGFIANSLVNAYKYFADGIGAEQSVEDYYSDAGICAQRGLFSYGGQCTRNYEIRFPVKSSVPQIFFNYAVLASWAEPMPTPPHYIPEDFPRSANANFPIYASIIDYSTLYYMDEAEHGGDIIFDIEIFDWSNFWEPDALKSKIARIVVEGDDGIIDGNHWEAGHPELLFLPGNTTISSRLMLQIPGNPTEEGIVDFLVTIEIDPKYSYDQGFGTTVPDAPLALYLRPLVEITACPGAMMGSMSSIQGSNGEVIPDIQIYGSGFVNGPDLAIRLEDTSTGTVIIGFDTQFIDSGQIITSLNLSNAIPGVFDLFCVNGCGTESSPPKNLITWDGKFKIVGEIPKLVKPSTVREGPYPDVVDSLHLSWSPAFYAQSYKIYIDTDPYSGPADGIDGLTDELQLLGETTTPGYIHDISSMIPFDNHSSYSYVVRSFYDLGSGDGESTDSDITFYSGQDFEEFDPDILTSLNGWGYRMEYGNPLYGNIGVQGYVGQGFSFIVDVYVPNAKWLIFYTPDIPQIPTATKAYFEFNHRHANFASENGYFVGYSDNELPSIYQYTVSDVIPIESVKNGAGYNDDYSTALMHDFGFADAYINNYQKSGGGWWGWYFSAFDVSDTLSEDDSYAIIGLSLQQYGYNHSFGLDDCALLVY